MLQRFLMLLLILLTTHACRKDSFPVEVGVLPLPVSGAVRVLQVHGDSLIFAGGDVGKAGFIGVYSLGLDSTTFLRTDLKREIYSFTYDGTFWWIGGDSLLLYRGKRLDQINQLYWPENSWVSDLSVHPLRDMQSDSVGVLAVAGGKLSFGALFHSYDGGAHWKPIEPDNELRCAALADGRAWVGGNGILMRSQWGSGEWERMRLEDQFLADLLFNDAEIGYALTHEGTMLHTRDGGATWSVVSGKRNRFMHRLARSGETILAVGERGTTMYQTSQDGPWQHTQLESEQDLFDVVIASGTCYMAADGGEVIRFSVEALK
jgi:hypothetical protein